MEKNYQVCPVCGKEVKRNERYPNYICIECNNDTTDENGRKVSFFSSYITEDTLTENISGIYEDTKEKYSSNICYVRDAKCRANMAKFGGIVIEKIE
jgi:predicted RNA-binding Zn-ribbon protein involved in translation (DUF1610 family)